MEIVKSILTRKDNGERLVFVSVKSLRLFLRSYFTGFSFQMDLSRWSTDAVDSFPQHNK